MSVLPPLTPAQNSPPLLIFSRLNGFFFPFFLRKRDFRGCFFTFLVRDIFGEGMFLRCALCRLRGFLLRCACLPLTRIPFALRVSAAYAGCFALRALPPAASLFSWTEAGHGPAPLLRLRRRLSTSIESEIRHVPSEFAESCSRRKK